MAAADSGAGGGGELTQFVAAFKEAAMQMDEEHARNLLLWSPLFLPTVQSLLQNSVQPAAPGTQLRAARQVAP